MPNKWTNYTDLTSQPATDDTFLVFDNSAGQVKEVAYDYLTKHVSVPSSSSDSGTKGDYAVDSSYLYICTSTNTWKRVGISSF